MVKRLQSQILAKYLTSFPVVALLGPRQCGKSTLAKEYIRDDPEWDYLDLERPSDLLKIADVELYFNSIGTKRVCIDEVQLRPDLFSVLRSIIDTDRREGRILLLGSASPQLLQQGSESLAGRISFLELTPFTLSEIRQTVSYKTHWLQGGFPQSTLLADTEMSLIWREDFIRTFVERDILPRGVRIDASQVKRLFSMCAHMQGQVFNISKLCESIGLSRQTVTSLLTMFEQTFLLRKVETYSSNLKKRMVKAPKIFVRDSGLLHALLGIETFGELLGNPVFGNSWEGYALENIVAENPRWKYYFYRTANGSEVDIVLVKGNRRIALEFKASMAPTMSKGFWLALEDIQPESTWIIVPEGDRYAIKEAVTVISLEQFLSSGVLE